MLARTPEKRSTFSNRPVLEEEKITVGATAKALSKIQPTPPLLRLRRLRRLGSIPLLIIPAAVPVHSLGRQLSAGMYIAADKYRRCAAFTSSAIIQLQRSSR